MQRHYDSQIINDYFVANIPKIVGTKSFMINRIVLAEHNALIFKDTYLHEDNNKNSDIYFKTIRDPDNKNEYKCVYKILPVQNDDLHKVDNLSINI